MIIDRIKNIEYYETILPGLKNGLNTLRQLPSQEVGRYEFEGGFLMIQEGTTKPMSEGPLRRTANMWMFRSCCRDARSSPGRNMIC